LAKAIWVTVFLDRVKASNTSEAGTIMAIARNIADSKEHWGNSRGMFWCCAADDSVQEFPMQGKLHL
jgi:hypothetical protein